MPSFRPQSLSLWPGTLIIAWGAHSKSSNKYRLTTYQSPPQDLETIIARDQDLHELIQGLVAPATRPPLSLKQRHKAFDNYLRLIYGSDLMVGMKSGPGSAMTFTLSDTSLLFFPVPGHKV